MGNETESETGNGTGNETEPKTRNGTGNGTGSETRNGMGNETESETGTEREGDKASNLTTVWYPKKIGCCVPIYSQGVCWPLYTQDRLTTQISIPVPPST